MPSSVRNAITEYYKTQGEFDTHYVTDLAIRAYEEQELHIDELFYSIFDESI